MRGLQSDVNDRYIEKKPQQEPRGFERGGAERETKEDLFPRDVERQAEEGYGRGLGLERTKEHESV